MDNILSLVGIAKKAGKLAVGEEPVGASCRDRKARVILLAADAAAATARRAAHFAEAGRVHFLTMPFTKAELGRAVGRTSCAMLAVTDTGLAAALAEKLAAEHSDTFAPAAKQLEQKAEKEHERQREQRRHEKKLQRGNKPWAAPPKKQKDDTQSKRRWPG